MPSALAADLLQDAAGLAGGQGLGGDHHFQEAGRGGLLLLLGGGDLGALGLAVLDFLGRGEASADDGALEVHVLERREALGVALGLGVAPGGGRGAAGLGLGRALAAAAGGFGGRRRLGLVSFSLAGGLLSTDEAMGRLPGGWAACCASTEGPAADVKAK